MLWNQIEPAGPPQAARSQQGSDDELNLITLCAACHEGLDRSC
jgi:cytochrome c553